MSNVENTHVVECEGRGWCSICASIPSVHGAAERVLDSLNLLGYPMSEAAWANVGDDAPVNNQASREAREMHRAAVDLRTALEHAQGRPKA